jgi:hypothetical protein
MKGSPMIGASRAMPLGCRTPFYALMAADLISQLGSMLTMIAP